MSAISADAPGTRQQARLRQVFPGRSRVFLPVVHVRDETQAAENVQIARDAGADGVFLINHGLGHQRLLRIAQEAAERNAKLFVGVNCLDLPAEGVFSRVPRCIRGVWTDNAGICAGDPDAAIRIRAAREQSDWDGLYFGGVAFKYQPLNGSPGEAARLAVDYVDVVTTSGSGTGVPPSVAKVAAMRGAIGMCPLAIASGITPENIVGFLPHADAFLVATGISQNFNNLDPARTRMLAALVHGYEDAMAPRAPAG
jgi:predicted TIM-barrel enzyme